MKSYEKPCYTLINIPSETEPVNDYQLKYDLELGNTKTKIKALKKAIYTVMSGEHIPGLLMTIMRSVLPLKNHTIKKLLLIFWEVYPKTTIDGKLLQEMILVCDAYRKDLQHPNEFVRGSTLRFLCKLREPELLEPLMPSIISCLEHRHSYVRRNAVLAIFTIYQNFEFLIPDAPELIATFLEGEEDLSSLRNAFLMLLHVDQSRALSYLVTRLDQVPSFGDILQLVIVELIYKVCLANPSERPRFIRCIYSLLNSPSSAVRYEAAGTLVTLSNAPTAIKAAAMCYIELVVKESDNNVKLIVLDKLIALVNNPMHERVLQDLCLDVLRVLVSPALEVRKKGLKLAMDLVTSRTLDGLVQILKNEVIKIGGEEHEDAGKFKQLLVQTLHTCAIKFPEVAATIIPALTDSLTDSNEAVAIDVIVFIREAIERFENLRPLIIEKLLDVFLQIRSVTVHRGAIWILGEYTFTKVDMEAFVYRIRCAVGPLPLLDAEERRINNEEPTKNVNDQKIPSQLITSDGTYASQSAFSSTTSKKDEKRPIFIQYMMDGDFFIGTALSVTLVKIILRYRSIVDDMRLRNKIKAELMIVMTSILLLGRSRLPKKAITHDDAERISLCLRSLAYPSEIVQKVFTEGCKDALGKMLTANAAEASQTEKAKEKSGNLVHVDDSIQFHQLNHGVVDFAGGAGDVFEQSLSAAIAGRPDSSGDQPAPNALSKVIQLTGFADPVYAEAIVHVNQYDILLDILIVNRSNDMLKNCTLELATVGDMKIFIRPQPFFLPPREFASVQANVKVSSTENGSIFGNIVYSVQKNCAEENVIILNDIHIDVMDYIVPATCTAAEFRKMWEDFEWENKVSVNSTFADLQEYLAHLLKSTNMRCLTPEKALSGQYGFMAANMYAKSIFGEHALVNLSIEKRLNKPEAPIVGLIRIRAKTQGMALSLGNKIYDVQNITYNKVVQAA